MSNSKHAKLFLPLMVMLVMLAAFALPAPAFAEEGDTTPVDSPAEEPVNRIPEIGHEPQAPREEVVIIRAEEPADPTEPMEEAPASEETPEVEVPSADAPLEEAPASETPQEETPAETETEEPVVSAEGTDGEEVEAQYNASLLNNVYFYNAANVAQWYADIDEAIAGFVSANGKGMIYASNQVSYGDALIINETANLTGLVFLDYDATESAKYGAAAFDLYNSANWAQITKTVTINDMPTFTLAGFKIAVDDANPAVKIDNDNGTTGILTLSYLDISNTAGTGLDIADQTGTINITAVKSTSTDGNGATLGSDGAINGKINITNSGFNKSGARGLQIQSTGLVTLTGVSASNNVTGEGLFLDGSGVIVKNSVFSNNGGHGFYYQSRGAGDLTVESSQFNNNADTGLFAGDFDMDSDVDFVRGNITLKNVRADNNGTTGINLDACGWNGTVCQNSGTGNVSVSNSNFEKNGQNAEGNGLIVLAKGNIALTSLWVGENGDDDTETGGAYLENIHSLTKSSITLTDCGFSYNRNTGVYVYSTGMITLKDTSAAGNQNAEAGAYLENTLGTAGVSLLNSIGRTNNFDNNSLLSDSEAGLYINTNGAVVMNQVYAGNNSTGSGAVIHNNSSASASNVTILYGDFSNNGEHGLQVLSKGVITATLTDYNLNGNGNSGLYLNNTYGDGSSASSAKAVTVDGGNYYTNNSYGIYVLSYGIVTVKNVRVGDTQNGTGVYISNAGSPTKAGITVTTTRAGWTNEFNWNNSMGLYIISKGNITVNNSNADENGESGAYLNNDVDGSVGSVLVTNSDFNRNNKNSGDIYGSLYILSRGNVSLNTVQANDNDEVTSENYAVYINNGTADLGPKPVSIINSEFNNNQSNGLYVNSHGAITITSVYVENNGGGGAMIENGDAATPQAVTVKTSQFNNNGGQGLNIQSRGAVTVTDANARDNTNGDGLVIDNRGSINNGVGDVKVTCTNDYCSFDNNNYHGVSIDSYGNITLSRVRAQNNFAGATLVNNGVWDTVPKTVTLSDCYFNSNINDTRWGLKVQSKGAISLKNVNAGDNAGFGVSLDNHLSPIKAGVTITGNANNWAWFGSNDSYGMYIYSLGKVVVSNVNSSDNPQYGLVVDNDDAGSDKGSVTINNAEFSRNIKDDYTATLYYSLNVTSQGVITLTNVYVNENGDGKDGDDGDGLMPVHGGARLDNTASSASVKPGITLTNVSFSRNYGNSSRNGDGLDAYTYGTITIKNIEANENSGYGAYLYNMYAGSTGTINISRTSTYSNGFNRNGDTGLNAQSNAAITIGNVISDDNGNEAGDFGVYLYNNSTNDDIASLITIKDSSFYNSGDNEAGTGSGGLGIFAEGAVLVSNVVSVGNVNDGIRINNSYLANQNLTLTKVTTSNNQYQGLEIEETSGNVIISNFSTYANSQQGAYIYTNSSNTSYGSVTLSGTNVANNNGGTGLEIEVFDSGNVSLTGVGAEKNGEAGIRIDDHRAHAGIVTLNKVNVNYNRMEGLNIYANNSVTLNTVYLLNNGTSGNYAGLSMGESSAAENNTFTILNSVIHGNTGNGINVDLFGGSGSIVVLTNTSYFGNDVNGDGQLDVYLH